MVSRLLVGASIVCVLLGSMPGTVAPAGAAPLEYGSTEVELGAVADVVFSESGDRVFVSVPDRNRVFVLDTDSWRVIDQLSFSAPRGLDLVEERLYVALSGGTSFARHDLDTGETTIRNVPALEDPGTWDVAEVEPGVVLLTANPGSFGFAYVVRYELESDTGTVVASDTIIRGAPHIVLDDARSSAYIGEPDFSPESIYRLDLTDPTYPIVAEDDHGDVSGTSAILVVPGGDRVILGDGQVLNTANMRPVRSPATADCSPSRRTGFSGCTHGGPASCSCMTRSRSSRLRNGG